MALGRGNIEIDIRGNLDTSGIARQVATAEKQIRPMNLGLALDEKGFRQPLGRISGDIAEFQKSLDASVARTLAFGAAVGVINAVSDAFKALVVSATEVEKALSDINVILNLNGQELQEFSNQLFDVAANTGQSFQTVAEAAVELSRQGLGAEETLLRINDAMILTRLSGMDAAKSVETLTAAVNSFGSAALTTTDLVNKLATVDAAFAVSTEDLANGLARAGSTAQAAKVDLNELLAAITSVQQTTARGGAVIGNAFKSIFTRLQRSGVREALEEIGVATTDSAGNIRGALDILQDYAQVYQTLTDSQQAYTDELIAGVFQINNLKALVKDLGSDYSIYQRALEQSNGATDEAIRRNEQLQTTLSALINEASVNAKELAATLGELIATPAVENLLKVFNSIAGALTEALDPDTGSKLIKGIFTTIGNFISGPGLIIIAAGFIKLFKFITGQSVKAIKEIFSIGEAKDKIADAEAKIGFLLKNNQALYQAISNEAASHEQKEELVLQTIKEQNRAYQQQQALISKIASSSNIRSALSSGPVNNNAEGYVPTASRGLIPNYANGISGAIQAEKDAVSSGVGGASRGAKPKVIKNFPMGGGKRETIVANTDEVIVPKFGGGTGSAIFNQDMIKKFGKPEGAIPVSRGYVPNFAKSKLESDKQFQSILSDFRGVNIDVQRDISGFGMLSAKGKRGNLDVTKKPGFSRDQKLEIINDIGGSTLSKDDKNYLLTTIGGTKKTRFSNIPSQTLESADPKQIRGKVGALNDLINPHIADAVANVATNIYTKVLGDEVSAKNLVTNVRASANADKGIISVGAQGDIFESAIRLGSKESAKGLARDDRSAIWDFEETGPISADLKGLFFPTSNIAKADAKRSGDQDSAGEVVKKAYKNTFDEQLRSVYGRSWAPIVSAAVKAAPAKQKTERKRTGTNLAGGYIPNFVTDEEKTQEWISTISKMKKLDKQKNPLFHTDNVDKLHDHLNINSAIISKDNFGKSTTSNKTKILQEAQKIQNISEVKYKEIYDNLIKHNRYRNINDKIQDFKSKKVTFKTKRDVGSAIEGQPSLFDNNIRATLSAFDKAGLNGKKIHEDVKSLVSNEASIKETRVIGNNFEEFVSTLGGQKFIQGPDAFDFAKSQKRGLEVDSTTKEQINMMTGARFGDAEKGSGHPREKFVSKTIRELAALGKLEGADKGKNINLNRAGNLFYDVVGKGRDKTEKVDLEFANFYNKSGRDTKEALRKAFAKRGSGAFGKDKQKRDEKLKGRLSSKASEETQQKYSAELSRLFDTETLQKNLQLTYKIDDIDPERLKVDKRTKRGKELSAKLAKYLESVDNKADGFIPNFFGQKINWEKDEKTKQWALSGNASELRYFGEYLEQVSQKDPKMVSPKAAAKFLSRAKSFDAVMEKEREEVNRKTPIGFGRQGRKHYDQMSFVSRRRRNVSIDGIFIKNLRDHVKQFNKHGSLFAADKIGSYDSFLADGYIPNFFNEAIEQRRGEKKKNRAKRRLDMSYFFPMASKGASAIKAVYKDIVGSAKAGRPYTDLDAGVVIGPRIPKLLFEGHRLLQQSRAKGVEIPKMKIDGYISPAQLMQKISKFAQEESEGMSQSPMDYKSGEEKEVESYLLKLGLNPTSQKNADIGNLPIFSKGFAAGFVPNFALRNTPIRLDGGFGRRGRQISDTESGSYMNYTTNDIGDREIDFLQSNRKGDAYKMFKREGEGRFMKKGGAYTSSTIKQQKSFKQGSSTNFEDLVYAFPQLQYRMQPNMVTTGRIIHGPERKRFRFESLKDLKGIVNKFDRESFKNALGAFPGTPGMDIISIEDLTTVNTKEEKADNIYKQFAEGLIPNFANQVYDKDKIPGQEAAQILQNILTNKKKKDLLIGPSGSGKTTLAQKYGEFIKSLDDVQEASSYTILSGAGKTKAGGMSPALLKIIDSVNKSGGKVSYLSVNDKTIEERREKRIASPIKGDLRSEGQLKGTRFAPKNQSGFADIIKSASNRFQIINAAEGIVPNFITDVQEGSRASLFRKKSKGNKTAKTRNFKHSVYLKSGERLSGVADNAAQDPFIGYDKNNQEFSVRRQYIKPEDIVRSKDGNKTAEKIKKELIEGKIFSDGYIPNFNKIAEQMAPGAKAKKPDSKKPLASRRLDLQWISSVESSGTSELRRIYKDIEQSAKAGKPYTQIDAGFVVGPRIPKILVEGQRLLNKARSSGKNIPKMKLNGVMTPGDITKYIHRNKEKLAAGDKFTTKADYMPGEEKEVEKYLRIMGLDPSSLNSVDLDEIQMFKNGFARGFIPSFAKKIQATKEQNEKIKLPQEILEDHVVQETFKTSEESMRVKPVSKKKIKKSIEEDNETIESSIVKFEESELSTLSDTMGRAVSKELNTKEFNKLSKPKQAAAGFIPNFANALQDAIVREEKALKSQGSSAKVYVDQDNRLKDSKNPMGLLVANRRDEPSGGFQGVNRAMSMGMNPKTHGMANGYIPNYVKEAGPGAFSESYTKSLIDSVKKSGKAAEDAAKSIGKQGDATKDMGDESNNSMGKLIAFQIALSSIESVLTQTGMVAEDFSLQWSQAGFAIAELGDDLVGNIAKKMQESGGTIGMLGGKLGAFGKNLGTLAVVGGLAKDVYDNFIDTNKKAIRSLDKEITSRNAAANTLSQNIEKIDQFAQAATKFGESLKGGKDAETTAKFLQEIFKSGRDVASLDPSAFQEVINSIGDTKKFNEAVQNFKNVANAGKDVNKFGTDVLNLAKVFRENDGDIGFDELQQKAGITFENIGKGLTQNLSPEKITALANELKGFDSASGDASKKLLSLQSVFGKLDGAVVSAINNQEGLSGQIIEQIKEQSIYTAALNKAASAMAKTRQPVEQLNAKLKELSQGMLLAAQNSKAAIDVLSQTGKIQAKSNLDTLQATTTVSQEDLLGGQAASEIKNGLMLAAKEQEGVLNNFAAKLIQQNKEGSNTLSGEMQSLISSISSGGASPEEAIKSLVNIQKTGSPEEKKAAQETIAQLRGISQNQIKNAAITNANLQAQLRALDAQAIAFQRNNILSNDQLKNLGSINGVFQSQSSLLKSQLEKLGEVKSAIDLIEDLGGSSDIIAALREENKQETQFENLQSAFEQLSGTTSQSLDLDQLNKEIFSFDLSKVESETAQLIKALNEAVGRAADPDVEGGVSTQEDVEEVTTLAFEENEITELANAMGDAVSSALAKNLGIGPEIAGEINKSINVQNIASAIEKSAAQNAVNLEKNAQIDKQIFEAFTGSIKQVDFSKLDSSSSNLSNASKALNDAATKLLSQGGSGGAAAGFVPNFAPIQPIERALNTERAMGAKRPVVDNHPSIGTYVRDAATQPNFSAVRRDHPEGISQAITNSKNAQGTKAKGFIPNFAESFFGGELAPEVNLETLSTIKGGKDLISKGKDALSQKDFKAWEKIKSMSPKELGKATLQHGTKIGGFSSLIGKSLNLAVDHFLGDIDGPSDSKLIRAIYFGSNGLSKTVPPFVQDQQTQNALAGLDKYAIAPVADLEIAKKGPFTPSKLDQSAIEESRKEFLKRKQSLFNLSLNNMRPLKAWGRTHATDEGTSELLSQVQNWGTKAGDWLGTGAVGALVLAPATGGITGAFALGAGALSTASYLVGTGAQILNHYLDTGIGKNQIENLNSEVLTQKLDQAMPTLFKSRYKSPKDFSESEQAAAEQTLQSNEFSFNLKDVVSEMQSRGGTFSLSNFLDKNSPKVSIQNTGDSASNNANLSNLIEKYKKAQSDKSGFYRLSKDMVESKINGSAGFFSNLTKAKSFEDTLINDFRLKVPFSFENENIGTSMTSWNTKELSSVHEQLKEKTKRHRQSIKNTEQVIENLKAEKTQDPNKNIKLKQAEQELSFHKKFLEQSEKAEKKAKDLGIAIDFSEERFFENAGGYDRLDRSLMVFPSPTDDSILKLRYPDAPQIASNYSLDREVSIPGHKNLSKAASEAIHEINIKQKYGNDAMNKLIQADFSEVLQNFTMLNPSGVSKGIDSATTFLSEKIDKELIGPQLIERDIQKLKQEKEIIDKFAKDEKITDEQSVLAKEVFGEKGLDVIEKSQNQKDELMQRKNKIRDALYLQSLGKGAENLLMGDSPIMDAQSRIERIESKKPELNQALNNFIKERKRRIKIINSRAPRQGDEKTLGQFSSEIKLAEDRLKLYNSAEGMGFLYFANRPAELNGIRMPYPIWQAPEGYNQKFQKIQDIIKMQEKGAKESELGSLHNETDAYLFAMMRSQQGNLGSDLGAKFEETFGAASIDQRRSVLERLGLVSQKLSKEKIAELLHGDLGGKQAGDPSAKEAKDNIKNNLKSLTGGSLADPFNFLVNEIMNHSKDAEQQAMFANAIQNLDIPFSVTGGIADKLKKEVVDIDHPQIGFFSPPALEPSDIEGAIRFARNFQTEEFAKRVEAAGNQGLTNQLNAILGQVSEEQLRKSPIFMQHNLPSLSADSFVNPSNVKNAELWSKKYNSLNLWQEYAGIEGYGPLNIPNTISSDPTPKHEYLDPFISDRAAIEKVIKFIDHGKNTAIEDLLANSAYPFPNINTDNWPSRHQEAVSKILEYYKTPKKRMELYAPFGYTMDGVDTPSGLPQHVESLEGVLRSSYKNEKNENNKAQGFVPNFSAVAGEIAASKAAGYKTPVTPSQVKTMNIPGVGKTAYNTQESVFKLPGMSQPFITPPSNSKAAKSYANTVQKKFNFNPYTKAADGFVPNFAPNQAGVDASALDALISSFSNIADSFSTSTATFQEAISNLDFQGLTNASEKILESSQASENQSNALKEAASLIQQGAATLTEGQAAQVDFSALTSAASTIQSSFESLSSKLNQPIELDSGTMVTAMNNLTNALGNVRGTIDVDIPDINVSIQGGQGIASAVKQVIETEVPKLVQKEIAGINISDQVRGFLS